MSEKTFNKDTVRSFYEKEIYGRWREGEKVSFELLGPDPKADSDRKPTNPFEVVGGELVKIRVEMADQNSQQGALTDANHQPGADPKPRSSEFTVHAYLPNREAAARYPKGSPFIICMHPIQPKDHALKQGYALIFMDSREIASDDTKHLGAFYDLYPYGAADTEQTGVLMAWAWGASKVLDAVYNGLGKALNLDPDAAMVTGVSRWGKATAVCGAFDQRFRMTIPACSGAGGLALYSVISEGKTYDLTAVGGPKDYTYTKNEPLDCLQSEAERGWFNDSFLKYRTPEAIPMDQENLVLLAMDPKRFYFIIAACMGEDWVNSPAMWECFRRADAVYAGEGLSDNLAVHFHKEGHAVIEEDMELIVDYFNHMYYGTGLKTDPKTLKTTVFDNSPDHS